MSDHESVVEVIAAPVKNKGGRPKGARRRAEKVTQVQLSEILALKAKGVPQALIARDYGLSEAGVNKIVNRFSVVFTELKNVDNFRAIRSKLYDAGQLAALKSLVREDKLDRAGVRDLALAVDILGKHSRLERGLSTANSQNLNINASFTLDGFLA